MTHQINKTLFEIRELLYEVCKFIENRKGRFTRKSAEAAIKELTDCCASIQSLLNMPRGSEIHLIQDLVSSALFYRNLLMSTKDVGKEIKQMQRRIGKHINRADYIENMYGYILQDMLDDEEDFKDTYEHARMLLQRFGFDIEEES
jgi:hypothetical protein